MQNSMQNSIAGIGQPMTFLYSGDWDVDTSGGKSTLHWLLRDSRQADFVIHNGDMAYDLDGWDGRHGDHFLRTIEPMTSSLPWIPNLGDHERDKHWTRNGIPLDEFIYDGYLNRFAPGLQPLSASSASGSPRYYSFNRGKVHFVLIDSDLWFHPPNYGLGDGQWNWLKKDLASVDLEKTPWKILMMHRSMYCSTHPSSPECHIESVRLRDGILLWPRYTFLLLQLLFLSLHVWVISDTTIFLINKLQNTFESGTTHAARFGTEVGEKMEPSIASQKSDSQSSVGEESPLLVNKEDEPLKSDRVSKALFDQGRLRLIIVFTLGVLGIFIWSVAYCMYPGFLPSMFLWSMQLGAVTSPHWQLERILNEHGVDLVLSGHTHVFERSWPTDAGVPQQDHFFEPVAPVYVVSGAATGGTTEAGEYVGAPPVWSVYRDTDKHRFSYGHVVVNSTHLTYEQRISGKCPLGIDQCKDLKYFPHVVHPGDSSRILDTFTIEKNTDKF